MLNLRGASVARHLAVAVVILLATRAPARADYPTDQALASVAIVERALDAFTRPAWFDGKRVASGTDAADGDRAVLACNHGLETFSSVFPKLKAKYQALDRARVVQRRYTDLVPYCAALAAAVDVHKQTLAAAAARQAQRDQAEAARVEKNRAAAAAVTAQQANEEAERVAKRVVFLHDIPPYGETFLNYYASTYDPNLQGNGTSGYGLSPQGLRDAKEGYLAVRAACAKHGPIPNPTDLAPDALIMSRPVEICAMADHAEAIIHKALVASALDGARYTIDDDLRTVRKIVDGEQPDVPEDLQLMLFDRAAFIAAENAPYLPKLKALGETIPADLWDRAFSRNAELQAKIDLDGTTKAFDAPPYHDRKAEAVAKAAFAKAVKGVKIRAIGTTYQTWNVYDEKTWVGSDDKYDYYKVNAGKNKYQRGFALLEVPGRPYCQAREWMVHRTYNGPIQIDVLGTLGTFVKCP